MYATPPRPCTGKIKIVCTEANYIIGIPIQPHICPAPRAMHKGSPIQQQLYGASPAGLDTDGLFSRYHSDVCLPCACQKEKKEKKGEKKEIKHWKESNSSWNCYAQLSVMMMNNKRARMGHFVSMITGPTWIHLPHTDFRWASLTWPTVKNRSLSKGCLPRAPLPS